MNRREFLKGALTSVVTAALPKDQSLQSPAPTPYKYFAEMTPDELDERVQQFLALAGDSTIVLNARFDSDGILWLTEPGSIVANCVFERGEVGFEPA